jgi:BirA family biotin operon repressor/biotin-[acetyl-CoA-carboxylase] ligase
MTAAREVWHLETRRLGRRVLVFDRVDSTNSVAQSLASGPDAEGLAILADEQSAGRGQHGRTWTAPPRVSVLLSVLLSPPPPLRRPVILTAWSAVAVCTLIRELSGRQSRIKWPNDVLVQGRKVCGILIEQGRGPGGAPATVVGIGLNVAQSPADFAAAGLPDAGSLGQLVSTPPDTREVARRLIVQLDQDYDALCAGELGTLEACWKWHIGLLGRPVQIECHDGTRQGRLRELSFDACEIETAAGLLTLVPEKIHHLSPFDPAG